MSTSEPAAATGVFAENIVAWKGATVLDPAGDKLGKLEEVYYDGESDEPAFAAVKSGTLSKHLTLIPLQGASVGPDYLRVAYVKGDLKKAPTYDTDVELTVDDEEATYRHFGMRYSPVLDTGRRLARR